MRHVGSVLPRFGQPLWLIALFIGSFLLPVLFMQVLKANWKLPALDQGAKSEEQSLFTKVLRIPQDVQSLEIAPSSALSPRRGEGFLMALWIQPRREARTRDRLPLLTRLDSGAPHRTGYQITVEGEGDSIRPRVYWQDSSGAGGWYLFNEFLAEPRVWYLLALSFTEDRYLGLHVATYRGADSKPEIRLLGGYELPGVVVPDPQAPLLIGAYRGSFLRSDFGAFGAGTFASDHDLQELIRSIAREPQSFLEEMSGGGFFDAELKDAGGALTVSTIKAKRTE